MSEKCIGVSNKEEIRDLKEKLNLLELEIKHVKESKVSIATLHELQLEISEIKLNLEDMQDGRKEDREAIKKLSTCMDEISSRLEEYLEGNANVLANQVISNDRQDRLKDCFDEMLKEMKSMNDRIKDNNVVSQIARFSRKSKFHKLITIAFFATIVMMFVSTAIFSLGGEVNVVDMAKYVMKWVKDVI